LVFSLRGLASANFQHPLGCSGETMHQIPKNFGDARTCSRSSIDHRAKLVDARISPACQGGQTCRVSCLFVYVSVTLLSDGVSAYDFAMMLLKYRNGFDRRRFVVEHPCSTFSDFCRPWSALAHKIWPLLIKRLGTGAPKCQNLPKIAFFVPGR